jgi:hypothetical protein
MIKVTPLKTMVRIFLLLGIGTLGFIGFAEAGNSHIRIIRQQGVEVRLDLSTQVLGLDIAEYISMGRSSVYSTVQQKGR